jgi:glutathione S-transferase
VINLYEMAVSGNCYKIRLLLHHLGVTYRRIEVEPGNSGTRSPDFLAKNPIGKVPTIELEPGVFLAESNAILCYFAEGTPYLPADRLERARVMQWLFYEQYSHEPYIAVMRAWKRYFGIPAGREGEVPMRMEKGYEALATMDRELATRPFMAGEQYTIADIALYAYTHVAGEGDFDLQPYAHLRAWLDRVVTQQGHVAINA